MTDATPVDFAAFAERLQALGSTTTAQTYADAYLAAHAGRFPIVEGTTAHFVYRAPAAAAVGVGGDWNGWNARKSPLAPLGGGLLHVAQDFEPDARLGYLYYTDAPTPSGAVSFADPLNLRVAPAGGGPHCELAMPDYRRPAVTWATPGGPAGHLVPGAMRSAALRQTRLYTVYLPAEYAAARGPYPSILFHDGDEYLSFAGAATILDNLIAAGTIPPVVGIFVPPVDRRKEYSCNARFTRFIGDELMPAVRAAYALTRDPARSAVIGPSLGGLISLYLGAERPDLFGLVAAPSAAVGTLPWRVPFDALESFAGGTPPGLRFALVTGRYEFLLQLRCEGPLPGPADAQPRAPRHPDRRRLSRLLRRAAAGP